MAKYLKPYPKRTPIYPEPKKDSRGHSHNFYRRNTWKNFRIAYIKALEDRQYKDINDLDIDDDMKLTLLRNVPVCEQCWSDYIKGFKPGVKQGKPLDHIKPVNPLDPMDTKGVYGEPLDTNNVQLLCEVCHSAKSSKDKKFHKNIKQ